MTTKKLLQNLLGMLIAEFVLGVMLMTVTEFKLDDMSGIVWTVLALHVIVALGLLAHAIMYAIKTKRKVQANLALVSVVISIVTGGALMGEDNPWLTFAMALGFIAASVVYVKELLIEGSSTRV